VPEFLASQSLTTRIANDALREEVESVRRIVTQILMARDRATAESALNRIFVEGNSVMESIGKVLRSLYLDEGAS
jgi:hypothetical protein